MSPTPRKPRDPRPVSEADVLKAVKALLEAKGFRCFRRNTGAVVGSYTSKRTGKTSKRFVRFSEPGMADLWGWYHSAFRQPLSTHPILTRGLHIECEIKAPGQKPTSAQYEWLKRASMYGALSLWCDSVGMAEAKLKEWGL